MALLTPESGPSERFQQPEAVLRALIESPRQIVIFALDRQYCYIAYNANHAATMRRIWGASISVGASMLALIRREDDREKARHNFDRALAGESFTLIEEYGDTQMERRFYEDVYSPVRDPSGEIIGVAVYLTDITEHRVAQLELDRYRGHLEELVEQRTQELEAVHARLLHAQKLESLGVLAGGIAHDFNNLLSIILGHAELCVAELPESTRGREHLSMIRETALEARMLTRQLLSYAGKGKLVIELLDLNRIVQAMAQLLRATISKDVRLQVEASAATIAVKGDATQLRQVILNLVTNAAEAIGARTGTIHVRTGTAEISAEVLQKACFSSSLRAGRCSFLEVEDTGPGIPDELKSRLFDPFYTTKFAGRGLGLAAVLGIVRSHQGTILLDTALSRGSCFRVLFPWVDAAQMPDAESPSSSVRPTLAGGCALVVDDEAPVRTATRETLQALGYSVLEADGGVAACEIFRQHHLVIDVVLLDLAMPDLNGEQTLRELKRMDGNVPVILLTAYAEDEFRTRFAPGDLAGFVSKPFTREELAATLTEAARRKQSRGESTGSDAPGSLRK